MSIKDMTQEGTALINFVAILALGLIVLGKFQGITGITTAANTAVGSSITALDDFVEWIGIIVLAIVFGIVYQKMKKATSD